MLLVAVDIFCSKAVDIFGAATEATGTEKEGAVGFMVVIADMVGIVGIEGASVGIEGAEFWGGALSSTVVVSNPPESATKSGFSAYFLNKTVPPNKSTIPT